MLNLSSYHAYCGYFLTDLERDLHTAHRTGGNIWTTVLDKFSDNSTVKQSLELLLYSYTYSWTRSLELLCLSDPFSLSFSPTHSPSAACNTKTLHQARTPTATYVPAFYQSRDSFFSTCICSVRAGFKTRVFKSDTCSGVIPRQFITVTRENLETCLMWTYEPSLTAFLRFVIPFPGVL